MYPNIADCLKNITFAPELIEKLIRAFITQWLLVLVLLIMWLDEVPHVSDAAHFLLYTSHRRCWVSKIAYIYNPIHKLSMNPWMNDDVHQGFVYCR